MTWRKGDSHPVWRGGRGVIPFILHYQQKQHRRAMLQQRRMIEAQMEQLRATGLSMEQVMEAIENDEPLPSPGHNPDEPTKH